MRTTLNLDDGMIKELQKVTGSTNKTRSITLAITSFIAQKKREKLLEMGGTMRLKPDLKKLREGR